MLLESTYGTGYLFSLNITPTISNTNLKMMVYPNRMYNSSFELVQYITANRRTKYSNLTSRYFLMVSRVSGTALFR